MKRIECQQFPAVIEFKQKYSVIKKLIKNKSYTLYISYDIATDIFGLNYEIFFFFNQEINFSKAFIYFLSILSF